MKVLKLVAFLSITATFLTLAPDARAQSSNAFTLQIGATAAVPLTLVDQTNTWSYRRGTNEPVANWQAMTDASLDGTWTTAPGGFGYGDIGITGEQTTLSGMVNVHSTLYTRKTFTVGTIADTNLHLRLTADYDDGFVAYLDGVEVARRNLTNAAGTFVAYNNITVTSHEASCCDAPTHPAEIIDLGAVSNRLAAGSHVLALIGVNGTLGSSDFHLIAGLQLDGSTSTTVNGTFFSLVTTNLVLLSGTNTMTGATRVTVNGADASFNSVAGAWSKTQSLAPGVNRLFIAALDANGNILSATNRDIIAQMSSTSVGGTLGGNTSWTSAMGVIRVTNDVVVPSGITLSVGSGAVVLLGSGVSIRATTGGTIDIAGTEASPDFFLPADGTAAWGALNATGSGASLTARHIETAAGAITFNTGANGLVEDAWLHDRASILTANSAGFITTRRLHVQNYSETIYNSGTIALAEDSLYEGLTVASSDCLEIQGGPPGSVVRRCTFRRSTGGNSDAVDFNGTSGAQVESCLIHDITDKGISLGASGTGGSPDYSILVSNCIIYRVDTGIAVKDGSTVGIYDTTLSGSPYGLKLYQKYTTPIGGGLVTNGFNNLIWGNTISLDLTNGAVVTMNYSDVQGTNWPGIGNISADPLFANAAAGDYTLGAGSPAIGTGLGGANLGAHGPVGGLPSKPFNLAAHAVGQNAPMLWWLDDADNEAGFSIERSTDAASWQVVGAAGANATNYTDGSTLVDQLYYYRVSATNFSGASRFSNIASARREGTTVFAGGTLTGNTVWTPGLGPIYVVSNVIVPTNITLTIEAGTLVRLTNSAMLIADAGGAIRIEGTWDNRVVLERWNGTNNWGEVRAIGTNAYLEIHFADISGAQTTVYSNATALIEDTFFHDFRQQGTTTLYNQPFILTHYAGPCTVRRCHLDNYHETLWRHGINVIEDTVFEHTSGDALDFDSGRPGSVIRRCTFRHGNLGNVDAIDIGNDGANGTEGAIIENCHMYDFPFDKGVSIGENSFNITVRNCLMHNVVRGVQVKDVCTANIYNCTITEASIGIHGYEKVAGTGAGRVTNSYNNILWGLSSNAIVYDPVKSIMVVDYTETGGTNWPTGTGNINSDPLFVNAAGGDWRLQPGSPCIGTGRDGANMGVTFPVGVFVTAPSGLAAAATPGAVLLTWHDNSPSEAVFLIERATDSEVFTNLANVPLNITSYVDASVLTGHAYRYRVRGANINTNSEYSNEILADAGLAVAITAPVDGTLLRCPTNLAIDAIATSAIGNVVQVEFFAGANSLGVLTSSPYTFVWSNVPLGSFVLTAVATENTGNHATSAPVNITAITNVAPVISITSPTNGASFAAPGPVTISTFASDADGNLATVEFFQGTSKLGEATSSPYNFAWTNVSAGTYTLTAVASDSVGLRATSAPVNITIQAMLPPWGALQLNGSSQYVTFGRAPTLGASNFTLETWVVWTGGGVSANSGAGGANAIPVITKGRGEGDNSNLDCNYFFGIQANGLLAADFEEYPTIGAGGTNQPIVGVTPVSTNEWHHIAATYDGTNWCLYLDGRLDNQRTVVTPPRWDSLQHAALGSALTSAGTAAGYFAGVLDEARIWSYARSASQISNSMTIPILSAPGLLGRWSLDETNGVLSYDTSGNNLHGTNINGPVRAWGHLFGAPPLVAITSPLDGGRFYTPGDLTISATATALVGTVTSVVFRIGTNDFSALTASPYTAVWTNPPAGNYVLTASATDLAGNTSTSAPINVLVIHDVPPVVALTTPSVDLTMAALSSLTLTASASDPDGAVTNVAFYANTTILGQLTNEPFTLVWSNMATGTYAVIAVATDNDGVSVTSAVVHVFASSATNPPVVIDVSPTPGPLEDLTQITVTFSKTVQGMNASDLLINGSPAGGMSGSDSNYTFLFVQPAFGTVSITWATNHGVTDLFTPANGFNENGSGATWQYQLGDFTPPVTTAVAPTPGAILPAFAAATVWFSENINGLEAADLLVNGSPATNLTGSGAGPYLFSFAQPANGLVEMSWASGHGIHDVAGNALTGTPWSYTLDTNVAGIVISEIMYHPQSENNDEEYIELFNSGATNINLAGWRLSQGVRFTFPGAIIAPGGYLVVAANVAAFTNLYPNVTNVVGGWEGILSNNRNSLHLDDALGRRVDAVTYASEGDWAVRQREVDLGFQGWKWLKEHDGRGKSLELINPSLPNEFGQNWTASLPTNGTPGRVNSVASANIAPLILDAQHRPPIPTSTDPVLVSARILDERASNVTVTLHWRVDAATPPPFVVTNMFDDGTHGDAVAGDRLFTATLPPQAQSALVEFYLRAQDQDGLVRFWPAPVLDTNAVSLGQVCNALYQVDTNGYTGDQPVYRLIMTERERAVLYQIQHGSFSTYPNPPGTAQSDAAMNGTFISLDGTGSDCRYSISIRNRGHGTRTAHPNNFRVNFNSDRLWKNVGALILNGQYTYCQVFGAALAQRSGLAGADSRAVQVRVNSTNLALLDNYPARTYGSYAANEALDSDWAEHHFPADGSGNIYRAVRDIYAPSANFEYRGDDKSGYTNCFFKQSNVSKDDWTDLASMLRVMGTNDLFAEENVRQAIDVEQWMLHLAVMTLLGNNETGLNGGYNDDYFMYRGVNDPRFTLVYYDLDSIVSFGRATNTSIWGCTTTHLSPPQDSGTAMSRLVHAPEFEPIYYRTLQRLLDTTFSAPQFNALINQVLGSYVSGSVIQGMTNWMNGRRGYVQSVIAPYVTAPASQPGALISGEPRAVTPLTSATLTVSGSGIVAYRFSLNGGDYSDEAPTNSVIALSALPHGSTNTLRVIGRDSAGLWQDTNSATVSRTWVVLTNWPSVRLNEVLARNGSAVNWYGQHPDMVELFNEGSETADLSGLRLTDDPASPGKFTFPPGTAVGPGAYLVVIAGNTDGTPGLHTGFALNQDGEGVYLLDRATNGDAILDSVEFGLQIADFSIGRLGSDASWVLAQPTLGSANTAQPLGLSQALTLNEWLALGQAPFADDFIELYNAAALPVSLGGLYLSDEPFGAPAMHGIAPLSFISPRGYQTFLADGDPQQGSNHLAFQMAAEQGLIALMDPDLFAIDEVWYGPQTLNLATGRCPDGSARITALTFPTPGSANACPPEPPEPLRFTLLSSTNLWRYEQSGADQGTAWRATDFDDSAWPQGPGVLGYAGTALPEPINTPLTVATSKTNFYFRTAFLVPTNLNLSDLQVTHLIDDGAVFYLNGQEAYRYNMPSGAILATTFASSTLDAGYVGPVSLPVTNLHAGTNYLAVEVHQATRTSSDIVLGCTLELLVYTNSATAAGLVLNEVLANNATLVEADGSTPDWVELYNPSDAAVDLSDMSLSDSAANPRRWVFPPGAAIESHGYQVIFFDSGAAVSDQNTGFGLKADGDAVYLFDKLAKGGAVLDFISFGLQTPDLSIGRMPGASTVWNLALPTPGATNLAAALGDPRQLRINEWMASPSSGDDWFEIYNPQPLPVALGSLWLTDTTAKWNNYQVPALSFMGVETNGFQRIWADNKTGGDHANFALKGSGEQLAIYTAAGVQVDAISFGLQTNGISQGRFPDGAAAMVFFTDPTPGNRNFLPLTGVVVSEVLAHTDPPVEDAIELQNISGAPVDLSGWWLSDGNDRPQKYQIPYGTVLPPGGFAVFYEYQFNDRDHAAIPFALSSAKGDEVYLSAANTNGVLTGYRISVKFGPSANGFSFGRYVTSTGDADFPPMSARSLGADNPADLLEFRSGTGRTNAYPLVGPVVISELMYHPPDVGTNDNVIDEFVVLQNITAQTIPLYDTNHPTNTWRLRDAVDFDFPSSANLAPGATLTVVSFDPVTNLAALAQFQAKYGTNGALFGPYTGKLDNGDESVELYRPDLPETQPGPDFNLVPYLLADRVHYRDRAPWQTNADGWGDSLHRVSLTGYGNDPTNWFAAAPTPGPRAPIDSDGDGMTDDWELAHSFDPHSPADALLDADGDGQSNLNEFLSGTDPRNAASVLRVESFANSGSDTQIGFLAIAGHTYSIEYRSVLGSGGWTNLTNIAARATNWTATVPDPGAGAAPQRIYRLVTPAQP